MFRALTTGLAALAVAIGGSGGGPVAGWPRDAGQVRKAGPSEPLTTLHFTRALTHADYERLLEQPFDVPAGVRRVEVAYEVSGVAERTVVDLGLRGPDGLRGWSGGSRRRIWVSRLGATPGYLPGAIEPGRWAVVLGVPNIRSGRTDTCEITVRLFADDLPVPDALTGRGPGWYVGDLHAHSGHSDGRARSRRGAAVGTPPHRVFDAAAAAGLDFITLTDHNTASHWLDVDRLQPFYDDLLLLHGREVTTYRGHANTTGERTAHEFRLPEPDASPAVVLAPIARDGAFVSINHPTAPDDERCMGCGWNVADAAVLGAVHGVEVVNGDASDGPLAGWPFWSGLLSQGYRLTAVGGSDDHTIDDPADRTVGRPTTVVWARELSEAAIVDGLKSGRVYVRVLGPAGPALDFSAEQDGVTTAMGGTVQGGGPIRLVARISGASGQMLEWVIDGRVVERTPVTDAPLSLLVPAGAGAWFSLVLRDVDGVTLFANAIYRR